MSRLGTKLGGKKGGRFMRKIFGKPGVSKLATKGAGKGLLRGGSKLLGGLGKAAGPLAFLATAGIGAFQRLE